LKIRSNLLRILFGVNLFFFIFCTLSPWAWMLKPSRFDHFFTREIYWSFQMVIYPFPETSGYENLLISWDFWFGSHDRFLLQDFWFSHDMYYYGFTFEWIRIFIYQLLTIFFGILVLIWRWQKTNYMLMPCFFSILSVLTGFLILSRLGYFQVSWGLFFAIPSALIFLALFIFKYALKKKTQAKLTN